jgi:hypothetical protein
MSRDPESPPDDVEVDGRPAELDRRRFLGSAAAAAVAAVGVPALLAACDSGSGTDARPDEPAQAPVGSGARMATVGADPWFVVHEKIAATIGAASNVRILALERTGTNSYLQRIITDDDRTGTGLATVLRSGYKFANSDGTTTGLSVYVYNSAGTRWVRRTIYKQSDLVYAMKDALASNTLADGVLRESLETGKPIIAIFKSAVVQFQASVSSDYYGNYLQVASRSASDIFNVSVSGYPLASTTRDLKMC